MEIRLCDITNNKTDIRDYFLVEDGKILINGTHLYDVIIDTDKVTLHQQMEMFDSKDEMFKKAKAFDEIENILNNYFENYGCYPSPKEYVQEVVSVIDNYKERADDER